MSGDATSKPLAEDIDAASWAREFIDQFTGYSVGGNTIDEGLMLGWFANAIMAGYDRAKRTQSALSETVPSGWREALRHIRVNLDAGGTSASSHDFLHTHGSALLDKVAEALEALPSAIAPSLPPEANELVAMMRDAKRYRWLRIDHGELQPFVGRYGGCFTRWTGKHADDCIDAAMREEA